MINIFWKVFSGFPEVLVVKGLNYVEYVVCWKQNENDKKKKKEKKRCVGDPRELGRCNLVSELRYTNT